jgi:formamidopyrimidine-DNA glycosylase
MPELPDVEVFRRYMESTSLHQRIQTVEVLDAALLDGVTPGDLREALEGAALEEAVRRGKHLMARISSGKWLCLHFGMTGFLKYYLKNENEPGHDRVRLSFENGHHLAYDCQRKLGRVGLAESPEHLASDEDLGPDALAPELTRDDFARMLQGKRGTLKSALMNQELLAGIGNVYSDEILFQLGLHPKAKLEDLDEAALGRVYETMRSVLAEAADHGADPPKLPDGMLTARRNIDDVCPRCGGGLDKVKVSGRNAVFCPACQAKGTV